MTVVVYVLAGIGATTLLAAVALTGAGWRSCRPVDAQAPPEPADWVLEAPVQWDRAKDEALTEWEREIRTPKYVEWCAGEELGL